MISLFTSEGSSKLMGTGEGTMERAETKKGRVFPALGKHRTLGFVDEFKHFLSALSTDQRALETFEEGYLVSRILGAAYRSSKTDSWESL
jgi:predicted dehydrogenase